ncbi:FimV/HubP family polar landmark protein [Shewanella spartinae]|uniref:FimV/HubP family polar landmark protein n=1 Tax=Shewanella spartinae TaxID=2864205 RepID=UPI001C65CF8F|nr:FimV/HubP family polar landmark protein [Shewanella spartinae]QYJ94181.1 hypothetical protein K0I31_01940 [Shewanella spartinae]
MKRVQYLVMLCLVLLGQAGLMSLPAWAKLTHVSINQRLSDLGQRPTLRVNIVAQSVNLDKVQFIVEQRSGSERLMVKPMNTYMLLLSGVEEVEDGEAQLVVKEYLVNNWQEVKRMPLFDAATAYQPSKSVKPKPVKSNTPVKTAKTDKLPSQSLAVAQQSLASLPPVDAGDRVQQGCQLDYAPPQTLWRLGSSYAKQWQLSTYGAMLAIFEANPNAFNGGKINGLRADVTLKCPSTALKQRYQSADAARAAFEALAAE